MSSGGESNCWEQVRVEVRNLQPLPVRLEVICAAARQALAAAGQGLDGLSVALVEADRMARLNRAYLGQDGPTDVIAFPADEEPEGRWGEVIICVPVAQEQAAEHKHSLERELAVLTAHGALHTLGYRDDTEAGRAEMGALQEEAAKRAMKETGRR